VDDRGATDFVRANTQQNTRNQQNTQDPTKLISALIGQVRIVPFQRTNQLAIAAPAFHHESLRRLIQNLDQQEPQVNIQTAILEVTRGKEKRVGFRWTGGPLSPGELDSSFFAINQLGFSDSFGGTDTAGALGSSVISGGDVNIAGMDRGVLAGDTNINVVLQMLLENTDSRILSSPELTVSNNEPGNIFVGEERPFRIGSQTANTGSTTDQVEYREVGIRLDITPVINPQDEIMLTVDLLNSVIAGTSPQGDPITNKSEIHSSIAVDSGQTMYIGGLRRDSIENVVTGIPILRDTIGRIPVLGWPFRKTDKVTAQRELLVLITPEKLDNRSEDDMLLNRAIERMERLDHDAIRKMIEESNANIPGRTTPPPDGSDNN
jgi:general secretion pathway protein D